MITPDNTQEKAVETLSASIGKYGDSQLSIKITARRPGSIVPASIAQFKDARLEHLNNIEAWSNKLLGGGEYGIVAWHNHPEVNMRRVTFPINMPGPAYASPNYAAISQSDWIGPAELLNAVPEAQVIPTPTQQQARPVVISTPMNGVVSPTGAVAQAAMQMPVDASQQLLRVHAEEQRANAMISQREAELRQKETEARMRTELLEREAKLKSDFEQKMMQVTQSQKPQTSPIEMFAALATALAPMANALIASNHEFKKMQMEQQRQLAEIQQKSTEAHNQLLMKMLEKPSGPSPEVEMMMQMTKVNTEVQGTMMTRMVDAMSTVSKTSIAMIETVAELNAPPEGSPILDAVKEGVKALGSLAGGVDKGARTQIQAQQQLPARAQAVQQQQQQRPRPEGVPQQTQQVQQQVQRQPQPQRQPEPKQADIVQFPSPAKPPPAQEVVEIQQQFGDMPDGFDSIKTAGLLDELERLIRVQHPAGAVAKFILDNLRHPEMVDALRAADGDPAVVIMSRLGMVDALTMQEYLEELGQEIEKQGTEMGIFEDDGEDDSGDVSDQETTTTGAAS
jgi:hypothetical protein